jgi:CheY-like chemotaxis protein
VAVTLTDTGVGMPAEVAARAFEPFFTTKPVGAGSGLGLSQVYGFGKQSGGETRLETAPGKGTTVTLLLPRAPSAVGTAGDTPPARASRSGGARVLLVEDDDTVAWTTEALIREFGHEVVRARDAQEALDRLAGGEATDVVLSDIVMPGEKSGVDLARELAATRPALPVILVTGYAGAAGDAEGSAFELLRKPYDAGALSRALDKALSEAGPQPA